MTSLKLKRLEHGADLPLPYYATEGAAGVDICSAVSKSLYAGDTHAVATGFAVEVPEGYELQVRSRSGLALKGIVVANSPGTIDSDYRGEIKVLLHNQRRTHYMVKRGERIAQLVLAPVTIANVVEVNELTDTARGEGGFGSTGV